MLTGLPGGIGLFLPGMILLTDGLKAAAGDEREEGTPGGGVGTGESGDPAVA